MVVAAAVVVAALGGPGPVSGGADAATAGGVVCCRSQMWLASVARALGLGYSVAASASLMDCGIRNKKN